jgi:hypothetical protein
VRVEGLQPATINRRLQALQSYCVLGLAIGSDQGINVGNVRNGTYLDAVTGNEIQVGGGSISFGVRANSAGIYVLNGLGRIGEEGPYLR